MRKRIRTMLQFAARTMIRHASNRSDRVITKLHHALFSLHRARRVSFFSREKRNGGRISRSRLRSRRKKPFLSQREKEEGGAKKSLFLLKKEMWGAFRLPVRSTGKDTPPAQQAKKLPTALEKRCPRHCRGKKINFPLYKPKFRAIIKSKNR